MFCSIHSTSGWEGLLRARLREAAQNAFKHRAHCLQRIVGRYAWRALVPAAPAVPVSEVNEM